MVKYVGNMHGDETVGREVLLALAEYLVKNYGAVNRVTELLDSTEVKPDGNDFLQAMFARSICCQQ